MDELLDRFKKTLREIHGELIPEADLDKMAKDLIASKPDKYQIDKSIHLEYFNNTITDESIDELAKDIESFGVLFTKKDKSKEAYNSISDIFTSIVLILGSEVTGNLLLGALGNGLWEIIVDWVRVTRENIKNKKLTKITGGTKIEEIEMDLYICFKIDELTRIDFIFKNNEDSINLREHLQEALKLVEKESKEEEIQLLSPRKRLRYDHEKKEWVQIAHL